MVVGTSTRPGLLVSKDVVASGSGLVRMLETGLAGTIA